jgi:hypothetical protein
VELVFTSFLRLSKEFIRVDLPTFERPANAISGSVGGGNCHGEDALRINSAERIFIFLYLLRTSLDQLFL